MNLADISAKITELTGYDTNRYPNANRLINLNLWQDKIADMIEDSQDESDFDDTSHGDYSIFDDDLVADQQDYPFPAGLFSVKRVELKLDGTNSRRASPIDINEIGSATDSTSLAGRFSTDSPYYDVQNSSVFIYPIPAQNVTDGISIWGSRDVKVISSGDLTTGTRVPGFPRAFIPMLAYGASWEIAQKDGLKNKDDIQAELQRYEQRLRTHYGRKQKDRVYQLKGADINYN